MAVSTPPHQNEGTAGPHVVIIGGFLTEPVNYRPMRQRLLARGAARVTVAPIHLPDWAAMGFAGMGPLMLRGARAIREARRASPRPLLVIGHSMGGIVARLAMSTETFEGRRAGVAGDVGCLVTLGTPHRLRPRIPWRHPGVRALEHVDRVPPRVSIEVPTAYLTVGSTLADPAHRGPVRSYGQLLARILVGFVGEAAGMRGDGLIANELCKLDGVPHIELPDVLHGTLGGPWYGDDRVIDRWWPSALEVWRDALAAQEVSRGGAPITDPV
jgi:pimeloyl-ACP methyl ester carboxylesterase